MAARWHINKNGEPAVCHATVRACPCGDQDHHFANRQEAEKYIERQNGSAGRSQGLKRGKARSTTVHRPSLNSQDFKPMRNQQGRLVGYAAQDRKTNRQVVLQPRRDGCSIMISSSAQGPYKGRFYYDSRTEGAAGKATDARSMIERYDQFVADQREHPTKLPQTAAKKQVQVKAAQWTGDPASMAQLQDLGMEWKPNPDGSMTISTLEGDLTYPKGSMVIQGPKGEFYANPDPKDFAKRYDQTPDGGFITKPSIIDTMEWSGDNVEDVKRFCPTASIGDDGELRVQTSWGETLACKKGDRISCYDPDKNDFAVIDKDVFQATYNPM